MIKHIRMFLATPMFILTYLQVAVFVVFAVINIIGILISAWLAASIAGEENMKKYNNKKEE